jgi:hypothetical protein
VLVQGKKKKKHQKKSGAVAAGGQTKQSLEGTMQ